MVFSGNPVVFQFHPTSFCQPKLDHPKVVVSNGGSDYTKAAEVPIQLAKKPHEKLLEKPLEKQLEISYTVRVDSLPHRK